MFLTFTHRMAALCIGVLSLQSLTNADCEPRWAEDISAIPGIDGEVHAIVRWERDGQPVLIAGGHFDIAGTRKANNIAQWDGEKWSAIGSGVDGTVYALEVFDSGSGPELYAAGQFVTAGGEFVGNIARWDGSEWARLDLGTNGRVNALEVFDDGTGPALYAGGKFTHAGGPPVSRIARWDGELWTTLGAGVNGDVNALLEFDDGSGSALYVGGSFSQAGGIASSTLAKWDGIQWIDCSGNITFGATHALTVHDVGTGDQIYAGGIFYLDINEDIFDEASVVRRLGSDWQRVGTAFGDTVLSLASHDDGNGPAIYASGRFALPINEDFRHIARFEEGEWMPVDGGVHHQYSKNFGGPKAVNTMLAFDTNASEQLIIGGNFTLAGNKPAFGVASLSGSSWTSVGDGISPPLEPESTSRPLSNHRPVPPHECFCAISSLGV